MSLFGSNFEQFILLLLDLFMCVNKGLEREWNYWWGEESRYIKIGIMRWRVIMTWLKSTVLLDRFLFPFLISCSTKIPFVAPYWPKVWILKNREATSHVLSWTMKWWCWGRDEGKQGCCVPSSGLLMMGLFASTDDILPLSRRRCQGGRCIRWCLCPFLMFLGHFWKGTGKLSYISRGLGYIYSIS